MTDGKRKPGAHAPFLPARAPLGKPDVQPTWRVLVHRQFLKRWEDLVPRVGAQGAQQLWDYLTTQPGQQSPYGCVSKLRGAPKGSITTWHYEVSGAGRVDFQCFPDLVATPGEPAHPTVKIVGIDYGSH